MIGHRIQALAPSRSSGNTARNMINHAQSTMARDSTMDKDFLILSKFGYLRSSSYYFKPRAGVPINWYCEFYTNCNYHVSFLVIHNLYICMICGKSKCLHDLWDIKVYSSTGPDLQLWVLLLKSSLGLVNGTFFQIFWTLFPIIEQYCHWVAPF